MYLRDFVGARTFPSNLSHLFVPSRTGEIRMKTISLTQLSRHITAIGGRILAVLFLAQTLGLGLVAGQSMNPGPTPSSTQTVQAVETPSSSSSEVEPEGATPPKKTQ